VAAEQTGDTSGFDRTLEEGDADKSMSGFERHFVALNRGQGAGFQDISGCSGADAIEDGRAAIFADFDNDGDQDIFTTTWTQGAGPEDLGRPGHLMYRNEVGASQGWVRVTLEGRQSGRDALGAEVRLTSALGTQTKVKMGGSGFISQFDPRLVFGIGAQDRVESIEVKWPSGVRQTFPGVPAGTSIRLVEGEESGVPVDESRFTLAGPKSHPVVRVPGIEVKIGKRFRRLRVGPPDAPSADYKETNWVKGAPYVVNFWATWCATCDAEMRDLQRVADAQGLKVFGVNLDADAGRGPKVARFAEQHGITYELLGIHPDDVESIFRKGKIRIPLSILVSAEGTVVDILEGWDRTARNKVIALGGGT
jgi:thiol-disulfide isomerase/thioredoxin